MFDPQTWELASYVVTVIGLPLAIFLFLLEQRKERATDEDEVYQLLSNAYNDFLKVVLANPDLRLRSEFATQDLSAEQQERITTAMSTLSQRERAAFVLRHFEGNSIEDISRSLGLKTNATKHSIFRAVKKMRAALEPFAQS